MENTAPKNIATSLKSDQFLNFFFKQLRRNDRVPRRSPDGVIPFEEYPFLSPCGKEKNYVKCADVPLVFHTLAESEGGPTGEVLVYGAQLEVGILLWGTTSCVSARHDCVAGSVRPCAAVLVTTWPHVPPSRWDAIRRTRLGPHPPCQ